MDDMKKLDANELDQVSGGLDIADSIQGKVNEKFRELYWSLYHASSNDEKASERKE